MYLRYLFAVTACIGVLIGFAQAQPPATGDVPQQTTPFRQIHPAEAQDIYFAAGNDLDPIQIARLETLEEKEDYLKEHENSLILLRMALPYRFSRPAGLTVTMMMPHHRQFRGLGHLLRVEAEILAQRGDITGAINSCLDALQFGTELRRDGVIVDFLVGNSVESIGRSGLWPLIAKAEGQTAQAAAKRLESVSARRHAFEEVLRAEVGYSIAELRKQEQFAHPAEKLPFTSEEVRKAYLELMEMQIAEAKKPYVISRQKTTKRMDGLLEDVGDGPYPHEMPDAAGAATALMNQVQPLIYSSRFFEARGRTENQLLMASFALQAYHARQNTYPDALAELVPAFLTGEPHDPFGEGALRYRRQGNSYVLYSVGPDGKDDGGQSISNEQHNREFQRIRPEPDSEGDVVAGINR